MENIFKPIHFVFVIAFVTLISLSRPGTTPYLFCQAQMIYARFSVQWRLFALCVARMDEDQCTKKNYQLMFHRRDPDYYEFEGNC